MGLLTSFWYYYSIVFYPIYIFFDMVFFSRNLWIILGCLSPVFLLYIVLIVYLLIKACIEACKEETVDSATAIITDQDESPCYSPPQVPGSSGVQTVMQDVSHNPDSSDSQTTESSHTTVKTAIMFPRTTKHDPQKALSEITRRANMSFAKSSLRKTSQFVTSTLRPKDQAADEIELLNRSSTSCYKGDDDVTIQVEESVLEDTVIEVSQEAGTIDDNEETRVEITEVDSTSNRDDESTYFGPSINSKNQTTPPSTREDTSEHLEPRYPSILRNNPVLYQIAATIHESLSPSSRNVSFVEDLKLQPLSSLRNDSMHNQTAANPKETFLSSRDVNSVEVLEDNTQSNLRNSSKLNQDADMPGEEGEANSEGNGNPPNARNSKQSKSPKSPLWREIYLGDV